MSTPIRAGFIGYGTIAKRVQEYIAQHSPGQVKIVAAIVRDVDKPRPEGAPRIVATLDELLAERPEVVVEAGGHDALAAYGPAVLRAGVDLLMVSVGAFARQGLMEEIVSAAKDGHARARIASGAIGAL